MLEMTQNYYEHGRTRIVCPVTVGSLVLEALTRLFIDTAGGCTTSSAVGNWHAFEGGRYESEEVAIFDVAGLDRDTMRQAASLILEAGQTDVYVELPGGAVTWFNRAEPRGGLAA